ncbi:hypothetical protein HanHA300_Chr12g0460791 [Helianthus annuus]|nr:hypothetical protein HanHA300_Chr12g0460791 [Helianthus annuus]KAJ0506796.1 hypothetical protein HanHA89_Chr12g0486191 [Helianthus annuus]
MMSIKFLQGMKIFTLFMPNDYKQTIIKMNKLYFSFFLYFLNSLYVNNISHMHIFRFNSQSLG